MMNRALRRVSFTVKDAAGTVRGCVVDEDAEHVVQSALVQLLCSSLAPLH